MNKEDLIYDVVCDIRDQNAKRFEAIERDIAEIKRWKNYLMGFCGAITIIGSFIIDGIKSMQIR